MFRALDELLLSGLPAPERFRLKKLLVDLYERLADESPAEAQSQSR